jgi:hypothetical protein
VGRKPGTLVCRIAFAAAERASIDAPIQCTT